jgi:hypothetical protein
MKEIRFFGKIIDLSAGVGKLQDEPAVPESKKGLTHTHTHTERERERERESDGSRSKGNRRQEFLIAKAEEIKATK